MLVASETHKNDDDDFSYFCLLLLKRCCSPTKTPPARTGKHHGPEGRTRPRIAPKKCLTSLLKPIENDDFSYFCLLLLKRCCSPTKTPPSRTGKHHGLEGRTSPRIAPKNSLTSLLKPIEKNIKGQFELLLSSAAEEVLLCPQRHHPPGRGNTMARQDELVREAHQKTL